MKCKTKQNKIEITAKFNKSSKIPVGLQYMCGSISAKMLNVFAPRIESCENNIHNS